MPRIILVCALSLGSALAADLPVKEVVLYKHGVGYFERAGELAGGEAARLDFQEQEMNDVLKSLMVTDSSGAKITGLRYDSSEPLARKLSVFPFQIGQQAPLSAFLDSLKGAKVEVQLGPETVRGVIMGARLIAGDEKRPQRDSLTLLLDSGELRMLDLAAATSLKLADPELQRQLKEYLAVIQTSRSREKRSVYIESSDVRSRQVVASYVIPTPAWKSSYRLIFASAGEPTLEGWAIVDNVTGEDWTKVKLSLVSGRPISFISKLYEPRYVARPTAELPEDRAQAPAVYAGAVDMEKAGVAAGVARAAGAPQALALRNMAPGSGGGIGGGVLPGQRVETFAKVQRSASSIEAEAMTREAGELFEYNFSGPVTVRKNESAMLPFLQQKIAARKLLIYSDQNSQYPVNAAEITNDSGKTLDGGPITVFDQNTYAGEALMETLKSSDKRLIGYAVDLGTRITTAFDSKSDIIREIHARRGVLTAKQALRETRTYTIRNVDQKPKTLIVEHSARPEYQLINLKPAEKTATAYRFEVKLGPASTEKLPVTEERVYETSWSLINLTPDILGSYVSNKEINEAARKQLERIARQKGSIAEADRSISLADQQFRDLSQDQERLRQNIASLNRVSGQQEQVQNYAKQLATDETQLAGLRDRQAELRKKKAALESELNAMIEKIEF